MPTCTTNGADVETPLLTVRFTAPDCAANPLMFNAPFESVVVKGDPFNFATDVARNPVPLTVVLNSPKGSGFVVIPVMLGAGGINVMFAVATPLGPVALTVSVPDAVDDVEEYLVSGIQPDQIRWLDAETT